MSVIPAKRGKATWHLHGIRAQMRADFPHQLYRQRAGVETLFSTTKRKLSARAPGRSAATQQRQALLLGVTFNLYRLRFPSVLLLSLFRMSTRPSYLIYLMVVTATLRFLYHVAPYRCSLSPCQLASLPPD
jgi:hypothetical protein